MRENLLTILLISVPAVATQGDIPCLPAGGSTELGFDRPPIDAPGMPADARWCDGDGAPEAWDKDFWSGPDKMGEATSSPDGSRATVTLTNHGGSVVGPNGAIVEGGLEGDCVEVYAVWYYEYTAWVKTCVEVRTESGIGVSECVTVQVRLRRWVRPDYDDPVEVCPC